jgi:hypothetical protein
MLNEITSLRSTVNILTSSPSPSPSTNASGPQFNMSPFTAQQINPYFQPVSPISPVSQHSTYQPIFAQGSSNGSLPSANQNTYQVGQVVRPQVSQPNHTPPPCLEDSPRLDVQLPHQATAPDPSPQLTSLETSTPSSSSGLRLKGKRRRKSVKPSDDGSSSSSSSSSSDSAISRTRKRLNHHDTRCYTIQVSFYFLLWYKFRYSVSRPILQHAMRNHVRRMMNIESETRLPDSHIEGNPLGPTEPVRFVWDKTTKQSVHNARMRARILEDIMAKRRNYKHVPRKEFSKKSVETAFEQRYVTLRQKFRVQRDDFTAENAKKREDHKAQKARHLSRRRIVRPITCLIIGTFSDHHSILQRNSTIDQKLA